MDTWSGMDVGKKTFEASWVSPEASAEEFNLIPHREFPMTRQGVVQYMKWLNHHREPDQTVRVIMEATGRYSLELLAWLIEQEPELAPAIVNPKMARHFQISLGLRNKTDAVDARSLGLMGRERRPRPYQPPAPEYQELRDIMRQRRALVQTLVAERDRLEKMGESKSVRRLLTSHINHLKKLLVRAEKAIDKLLEKSSQLRQDLTRLTSIPGIGRITAMTVLGELGDLRRFGRSRQVSAMAGLSPHIFESGTSLKRTRMDRMGSPEVRSVLYMAALAATRNIQNHLARTYQHLINDNGLCKKAALVAIMRKMLVIMRALLISESNYRDNFAALT